MIDFTILVWKCVSCLRLTVHKYHPKTSTRPEAWRDESLGTYASLATMDRDSCLVGSYKDGLHGIFVGSPIWTIMDVFFLPAQQHQYLIQAAFHWYRSNGNISITISGFNFPQDIMPQNWRLCGTDH